MKVVKVVGIVLGAVVLTVVVLGLVAPKGYHVERSIIIHAPRSLVFNHVRYWASWEEWIPWAAMDSTMRTTVEGIDGTPGSKYLWQGQKVGKGEMVNTGVVPGEEMTYLLRFIKPFASESNGCVRAKEANGTTEVSWAFFGRSPFPWNIFNLVMSMDKMVGKDYEAGLQRLKEVCEGQWARVQQHHVGPSTFGPRRFAVVRKQVGMNELQAFLGQAYGTLMTALDKQGVTMVGAPCGLYYTWDESTGSTDVAAAVPVTAATKGLEVEVVQIPASNCLVVDFRGPYEKSIEAHLALEFHLRNRGLRQKPPVIEEYLTGPAQEPDPDKWLTRIYYLVE